MWSVEKDALNLVYEALCHNTDVFLKSENWMIWVLLVLWQKWNAGIN